jgi:hypothetical protein
VIGKPTVADLGLDPDQQRWQRSGDGDRDGDGAIEIAFARAPLDPRDPGDWVLMRVTGDPDGRVLVFDRNEWECFLDGARKGEFDDAAAIPRN